jgi:curved DNA-binding protein CbpA
MTVLYGIAAVALLWVLVNLFARADTAAIAKAVRVTGGLLAMGAAVMLGLRGRIDMALPLGGLGIWLLGGTGLKIPGFQGRKPQTSGVSRVRSIMIEMELDHDTGEMDGSVLAGSMAGQRLNALDTASLQQLLAECRIGDPEGVRLLVAYLDRRFPEWRETAQDNAHNRQGASPRSSKMTEDEAYKILGLQTGASAEDIRKAHRTLMKKLHPDQGGSTYLAARVNEAKDILLSPHR